MKKTVISAMALLMLSAALPSAAQVFPISQETNYLRDLKAWQDEKAAQKEAEAKCLAGTLLSAAQKGDEDCVKMLAEKNDYTIQEYKQAFDAAANQPTRNRLYIKAVNQLVKDSSSRVDVPAGGGFSPATFYTQYRIDYKKYYPENSAEYNKKTEIISDYSQLFSRDIVRQVVGLVKPILNYLLGEARTKTISPNVLAYDGGDITGAPDKAALSKINAAGAKIQFPKA